MSIREICAGAESGCRASVAANPHDSAALCQLGIVLAEQGRRALAIGYFSRAIELGDEEAARHLLNLNPKYYAAYAVDDSCRDWGVIPSGESLQDARDAAHAYAARTGEVTRVVGF
jgi:tetratricopeptide (TPR) repeat protein